jgi:hypothetical protein
LFDLFLIATLTFVGVVRRYQPLLIVLDALVAGDLGTTDAINFDVEAYPTFSVAGPAVFPEHLHFRHDRLVSGRVKLLLAVDAHALPYAAQTNLYQIPSYWSNWPYDLFDAGKTDLNIAFVALVDHHFCVFDPALVASRFTFTCFLFVLYSLFNE